VYVRVRVRGCGGGCCDVLVGGGGSRPAQHPPNIYAVLTNSTINQKRWGEGIV